MTTDSPRWLEQLSTLEQENALLKSRLETCETSCSLLQAEVIRYRHLDGQASDGQTRDRLLELTAIAANTLLTNEDFDDAIKSVLEMIGEGLKTDRMSVIEFFEPPSPLPPHWQVIYEWTSPGTPQQMTHPDWIEGSFDGIEDIYDQCCRGQPVSRFIDTMADPFRSVQAQQGVKGLYAIPISVNGHLWGVVGFDDCRVAKQRSMAELSTLKIAADCIGSAIERQRTQQVLLQTQQQRVEELATANAELKQALDRLSESEHCYRTLFELSNEGISRFEFEQPVSTSLPIETQLDLTLQHYRYVEANEAFCAQMGLSIDQLREFTLNDFHGDLEANRQVNRSILTNGYRIKNAETEEIDALGRHRYFLNNVVCNVSDGFLWGGWCTQTDITELRETQQALLQAEQARSAELAKANEVLQQRDRLLSVVAGVTKDLLRSSQVEETIVQAFQQIGEVAGISRITLMHEKLEDSSGRLQHHVIQEWTAPGVSRQMDDPVTKAIYSDEYAVLVDELHAGRSVWYVLEGLPEPMRTQQAGIEVKSTGAVPIFIEGEYFGCVAFDDCIDYRQWTQQEIDVLSSGSDAIGAALHRKQLVDRLIAERLQAEQNRSAELAKANEALKRSLDSLASEPSLDKFLGHVLKIIGEQLDAPLTEYWYHPEPDNIAYLGLTYWQGQILKPEEQSGHPGAFGYPVPPEMIHQESLHHRRGHFVTDDIAISEVHNRIAQEYGLDAGAWYKQYGVSRFLNVPLILGNKTIGALIVFAPSDRDFTEQQIELTYALAQQVTLAIQLTCLAEEAKQTAIAREQEKAAQERAAELAKANEVLGRSLNRLANERNLDSFLEHILQEALQMLNGAIAQFFVYDPEADTLTPSVGVDVQGEVLPAPGLMNNLPVSASFPVSITKAWERMLNQRSPIYFDTIRDADDYWPGTLEWHQGMGHCGSICTALTMGDQPLGMLGLALRARTEFTASEFEFFQALGQQATLAIQLTRLAEEAKQAAIFEERNRMASEIHDTLAQAFTGISIQLEVVNPLVEQDPQAAQQILNHIRQLAENGLNEARRSVWALYPPAAEYADLAQLLYDSVEQMTRNTSTTVEVDLQGNPCPLPPFIGMNLLRIGQEALTNALKHAQAKTITIELVYEVDRILLTICDDGRGFTPPTTIDPLNGGFGLLGMYERCDRISAQISITSALGEGTQVLVEASLA